MSARAKDLAKQAAKNIEAGSDTLLVVPRGSRRRWPERIRLAGGTGGVKTLWGSPVADVGRGLLVRVGSTDLLAWLVAYAGVEMEVIMRGEPGEKVLCRDMRGDW